jgi:pimeloyl-ACP methyl ester carboxylesterase
MMVHGQYDDVANVKQLMPFFEQLPNSNKRYVVVPNAGHMLMYQKGYTIFQHVVCDYFSERF